MKALKLPTLLEMEALATWLELSEGEQAMRPQTVAQKNDTDENVIKFWGPHEIGGPWPQSPGNMGPPP